MTSNSLDIASSFRRVPMEPVALVSAIAGDRDAVEGVLRWIRPFVVQYCRAHVGGGEKAFASADDVAQEVYLAVVTALPSYRDQGRPFLAFVYGIAAHKVADAHRSATRNRAEPVAEVPDVPDTANSPEAQVLQVELAGLMATLLEMLPNHQREVLRLRVVVGLSAKETAEAVGSTPGAVRVVQHRTLSRLRSMLATETMNSRHTNPHRVTSGLLDERRGGRDPVRLAAQIVEFWQTRGRLPVRS